MTTAGRAAAGVEPAVGTQARRRAGDFYVRMACVSAAIAFIGFTPTYWAPIATGAAGAPPVVHLHGLLFSAWTIFFIVQARLAAGASLRTHRVLGMAGIALATAMLFAGVMVAVHAMRVGIASGFEQRAREFAIVPVTIVLFFAGVVAAAIAWGRQPQVHKRLMLVATISLLPPAFARLLRLVLQPEGTVLGPPPSVPFTIVPNLLADLLLVGAIVYDWRTRGRPHPAYLVAGACLLFVQVVRIPLASTRAWHAVADWLLRFGG